ncbi:DUF2460 domain-containing protein [Pontivivens insulae]|uniref:DUF2460 domain-containing protein n=1 Tax=Pontivivens insulae TaxID=1639689 RepID=A0A2R8AAX1_9RHOB|nr:DUF2460 domain-containing protein [Pontivivens insulae]RED13088.1 uncharacterized protein (TIGR02217 family) [Pontivivens insulae]SPF29180.1 hypothetical protein POI8812_01487 [Pontivivens insulae]
MSFHEVRFPAQLSFGSSGGPERRTEIVTLASGHEQRNSPWAHGRRRYDAGTGVRSLDDLELVTGFFEARMGQLYGFRWKDWVDFRSGSRDRVPEATDQVIATGDGTTRAFQLVKTYASGPASYVRPIVKPVDLTVRAAIDGVELFDDFSVDLTTGIVTFDDPPQDGAAVSAGYEFDVPVRFDTDFIETNIAAFEAGEIPSIPVIEVRV